MVMYGMFLGDIDEYSVYNRSISTKFCGINIHKRKERIYHYGISFQGLRDKANHLINRKGSLAAIERAHAQLLFSLTSTQALFNSTSTSKKRNERPSCAGSKRSLRIIRPNASIPRKTRNMRGRRFKILLKSICDFFLLYSRRHIWRCR